MEFEQISMYKVCFGQVLTELLFMLSFVRISVTWARGSRV